jgi:hypothetical protein
MRCEQTQRQLQLCDDLHCIRPLTVCTFVTITLVIELSYLSGYSLLCLLLPLTASEIDIGVSKLSVASQYHVNISFLSCGRNSPGGGVLQLIPCRCSTAIKPTNIIWSIYDKIITNINNGRWSLDILSMILVGALWGCTNPFLRKATMADTATSHNTNSQRNQDVSTSVIEQQLILYHNPLEARLDWRNGERFLRLDR